MTGVLVVPLVVKNAVLVSLRLFGFKRSTPGAFVVSLRALSPKRGYPLGAKPRRKTCLVFKDVNIVHRGVR